MTIAVYLAGPDVFLREARHVGERKLALCRRFGLEGLYPLDAGGVASDDPAAIYRANCRSMRRADAGIFNLTPFRGASADAGTVFELGYMTALGKPLFAYSSQADDYRRRVEAGFGPVTADGDRLSDCHGHGIETFGLADNLMLESALLEAGGRLLVVPEAHPGGDRGDGLAAFAAFEACLVEVRRHFDLDRPAPQPRPAPRGTALGDP